MSRRAVLIDEFDRRLGTLIVAQATTIIQHQGSFFVRTEKSVKLRPNQTALAVVFEHTDVYVRDRLEQC